MQGSRKREERVVLPVEKLGVFQRAYTLSLRVHQLSLDFPKYEQYKGLAAQLRDSSRSIVLNLGEGYAFKYRKPKRFANHLEISIGSCDETRIGLKYGLDLGYIKRDDYEELEGGYSEVGKMLWGLLTSVEKSA